MKLVVIQRLGMARARLEAELKYFGKYKSKVNETYQTELQNSGTKDSSEKA